MASPKRPDSSWPLSGQDADTWLFDDPATAEEPVRQPAAFAERYERQDQLGRGGMGEVWRAWDELLQRPVAMKVLREDRRDRAAVERFLTEARITGQLEHPGIAAVHDIGRDEQGRPFFTMEEVRGSSLQELLARALPSRAEQQRRLRILLRVSEALAFAHANGVVHRDLKPANIMVGAFGEVRLMDWGLAARVQDEAPPLQGGTPAYMAPEQLEGQERSATPSSDVFAFGCVLYECLAGRSPFASPDIGDVLSTYARARHVRPAEGHERTGASMPRDLELVAMRAMSADPRDRHPDMQSLQQDLAAWLEGRPVPTVRYRRRELLAKWLRRNRAALRAAAAVGVAASFLLSFGLTRYVQDTRQQAQRALRAEQETQAALVEAELAAGQALTASGDMRGAREHFRRALGRVEEDSAQGVQARLGLWTTHNRGESPVARIDPAPGAHLRLEGSGEHLLLAEGRRVELRPLLTVGTPERWELPGEVLAVGFHDGEPQAWLVEEGDLVRVQLRSQERTVLGPAPADDAVLEPVPGGVLVRTGTVHPLGLLLPDQGEPWDLGPAHTVWVGRDHVLAGGYRSPTRLWERSSRRLLREPCATSCKAAQTPDSTRLLLLDEHNYELRAEDPSSGATIWRADGARIEQLSLSPDGQQLYLGALDGTIVVRDSATGRELTRMHGHDGPVQDIQVGATLVLSRGARGEVLLWRRPGQRSTGLVATRSLTSIIDLSTDGHLLLLGDPEALELLDVTTGRHLWQGAPVPGDPWTTRIVDGGRAILSAGPELGSWRLSLPDGQWERLDDRAAVAAEMLADGRLVLGLQDGGVTVVQPGGEPSWSAAEPLGRPAWSLQVFEEADRVLAAGFEPPTVAAWQLSTGQRLFRAELTDTEGLYGIDLHPDAQGLLVGSRDGSIRSLRFDGSPEVRLEGAHDGPVLAVDWREEDGLIAAGGFDGRVALYRPDGELLAVDDSHHTAVPLVRWQEDGSLLSASTTCRVLRQQLDLDAELLAAREVVADPEQSPPRVRAEAYARLGLTRLAAKARSREGHPIGGWLALGQELWATGQRKAAADAISQARRDQEAPAAYLELLEAAARSRDGELHGQR